MKRDEDVRVYPEIENPSLRKAYELVYRFVREQRRQVRSIEDLEPLVANFQFYVGQYLKEIANADRITPKEFREQLPNVLNILQNRLQELEGDDDVQVLLVKNTELNNNYHMIFPLFAYLKNKNNFLDANQVTGVEAVMAMLYAKVLSLETPATAEALAPILHKRMHDWLIMPDMTHGEMDFISLYSYVANQHSEESPTARALYNALFFDATKPWAPDSAKEEVKRLRELVRTGSMREHREALKDHAASDTSSLDTSSAASSEERTNLSPELQAVVNAYTPEAMASLIVQCYLSQEEQADTLDDILPLVRTHDLDEATLRDNSAPVEKFTPDTEIVFREAFKNINSEDVRLRLALDALTYMLDNIKPELLITEYKKSMQMIVKQMILKEMNIDHINQKIQEMTDNAFNQYLDASNSLNTPGAIKAGKKASLKAFEQLAVVLYVTPKECVTPDLFKHLACLDTKTRYTDAYAPDIKSLTREALSEHILYSLSGSIKLKGVVAQQSTVEGSYQHRKGAKILNHLLAEHPDSVLSAITQAKRNFWTKESHTLREYKDSAHLLYPQLFPKRKKVAALSEAKRPGEKSAFQTEYQKAYKTK